MQKQLGASTFCEYDHEIFQLIPRLAISEWLDATENLPLELDPTEILGPCGCTGVTCPLSGQGTS